LCGLKTTIRLRRSMVTAHHSSHRSDRSQPRRTGSRRRRSMVRGRCDGWVNITAHTRTVYVHDWSVSQSVSPSLLYRYVTKCAADMTTHTHTHTHTHMSQRSKSDLQCVRACVGSTCQVTFLNLLSATSHSSSVACFTLKFHRSSFLVAEEVCDKLRTCYEEVTRKLLPWNLAFSPLCPPACRASYLFCWFF